MTMGTDVPRTEAFTRYHRRQAYIAPLRMPSYSFPINKDQESPQHSAELFYLQKQIQSQTPMVVVLEDGEKIEGCIEWYDRNSLKLRGRQKNLIYKSAIKYMYKVGDQG
jgi:RNA chaperone Hfq